MSKTIVFSGHSGEQYRFEVLPLRTALKSVAGVYIVTRRTLEDRTFATKGTHQPVMIGRTDDFAALQFTGAQAKTFAIRGAEYICVSAVPDAAERVRIERDLLEAHERNGAFLQHLVAPQPPQSTPGGTTA
ncbi:MAG TPA: hypothetical protein VED01_05905 [Burkholderiales bacterium]|nr:hypothetical protein [Burkholderiales bacterium]